MKKRSNPPPLAKQRAMYSVRPIRCGCHHETCCCADFELLKDEERVATGNDYFALEEIADAMNKQSESN